MKMPKIVIEFDLPEGQDIPSAEDIVRLTSPDWHSEWWHFEDVQSVAEDLTDDEAREVLRYMNKYSDCNVGINWETIQVWADIVKDERPETEENEWEIRYDDSGESERYGEGRWFVADETGMVLGDASFHTKQEAEDFLKECLENGDA
jgi:hypothetical protein